MKYVAWGILILLCFVLGRVMYLPLAPALTGEGSGSGKKSASRQVVVFGPGTRQVEVSLDLKSVRDDEVPSSVTLLKRALVSADDGSDETEISANDTVRVIERKGSTLKISAGGPLTGLVPIKNTDFAKRVIETRLGPLLDGSAIAQAPGTGTLPPVAGTPGPGTGTPPAPKPVEPAPAPKPADPKPAEPKPATPTPGTPVAVTDPEKMDPEKMDPEPAEPEGGGKLSEEQIIELMKKSIAAGDIKEFTVGQVQAWKAGPEEEIDDVLYQTGLAAYKAATIFGDKIVQAKALIKDGKVEKWIYSKTGMEIR